MRLSTRSTYGVRAMHNLAMNYDEGPTSVLNIAKHEGISVQYLEQLLNRLKKRGLVKSVRGPKGGYILAKSPGKIKIGDIVRNLEGEVGLVNCFGNNGAIHCKKTESCATKSLWVNLKKSIDDVLDTTTLKDLAIKKIKTNTFSARGGSALLAEKKRFKKDAL